MRKNKKLHFSTNDVITKNKNDWHSRSNIAP